MIRKTKSQDKLLYSARNLFFTKGYINTSIDDIVQNIGMSKATLYRYYNTKEDLLKAVAEAFYGDIREFICKIASENIEFTKKLEKFILQLSSKLKEVNPVLLKDLQTCEPFLYRFIYEERASTIEVQLKSLLLQGIDQGAVNSEYNIDLVVGLILSSIDQMSSSAFIEKTGMTYEHVFRQIVSIITKGICQ